MNKYFEIYFKKLESCGVPQECCDKLKEVYGAPLESMGYNTKMDSGLAYDGALIDTVLTKLTVFAININNLYPENIRVDKNSIIKVCLLQHISKCLRMTKSNDEWRINKLGEVYTYTEGMPAIGTGLHSLIMANNVGITFTDLEAEAMTIIDRKDDDLQAKYHSSILSSIIKQANEMVYIQQQELKKLEKKVNG